MSRIGLPNSTSAGDDLVIGSTVFLYDRMACWNLSTSREPDGLQLSAMIRLTCFTPSGRVSDRREAMLDSPIF